MNLPNRRDVLQRAAGGFGAIALHGMLADEMFAQEAQSPADPLAPKKPHREPKAKRVIFLYMTGGVSHVDSFDPKPKLKELDNQPAGEVDNPTANKNRKWLRSPWSFCQHGESGLPVSELFPHIASCVDDIAVIRSMKADLPIHSTGVLFLHTGLNNAGRPSLGSWVNYGLGSGNENLPGFVVLSFGVVPCGGLENYSNGFLPANYQATMLNADGIPLDNITPADRSASIQRAKLDLLKLQDGAFSRSLGGNDAVESAIKNYELAYRMQSLVPDVLDLNQETQATHQLYGVNSQVDSQRLYGIQCLRARRLIESGVRFVEITCPPGPSNGAWDQHNDLKKMHEKNALDTDQAIAGLIKDLKQRGLFEETLIIWAGEFGRKPHSSGRDGRDHHPEGFTVWLAGGGIKGGMSYGNTDDFGYFAVDNPVHVHDLHATMLHLLGIDHERMTYRFQGRDFRLTDVHGNVVHDILA